MFNESGSNYADYPTRLDREYRQAIALKLSNFLNIFAISFACLVLIFLLGYLCLQLPRLGRNNRQEPDETEPFAIFHPELPPHLSLIHI